MNEAIQAKEVRLVSESGQQVFPTVQALDMAIEMGLDLILISESDPPVCKILDGGKYKFELQKKKSRTSRIRKQSKQRKSV